jgi:peptidyl-prolyl cis-trans isomerase SurA
MKLFGIFTFTLLIILSSQSMAQRSDSIAAVVNGDVVTYTDLYDRMNLVMKSSGMPSKNDLKKQLLPQILTGLITEKIQLQEAERLNITVSEDEIENGFANIATSNNLKPEQFAKILKRQKVNSSTLKQQLHAQLAWNKVIQSQIRPRVVLGDSDISAELSRLKAREGQTEYSMAEIFLSYDNPDKKEETLNAAKDLIKELSKDVQKFPAAAKQFSQNASAASGGIIGWVTLDQMAPDVASIVKQLPARTLSEPIAVDNGYTIMFIREKRIIDIADETDESMAQLRLKVAHFLLPKDQAERDAIVKQSKNFALNLKGCLDIVKKAASDKLIKLNDIEGTKETIAVDIYNAIANKSIGESTTPIERDNEIVVPMLCGRTGGLSGGNTPSAAEMEIEQRMGMQRMDILQKRYLRDLISEAYIERRV